MKLPDISLSGPMRSGKTTCQDYLVRKYGYVPMSFAHALKFEVARGMGVSIEDLEREPTKSQVRGVLQYWGTDFRRKYIPDHWVYRLAVRHQEFREEYPDRPIVIADTRFKNELNYLRDAGFTTVKLTMTTEDVYKYFVERGNPPGQTEFQGMMLHDSEHDLDKERFDLVINSKRGDIHQLLADLELAVVFEPKTYEEQEAARDT